MKKFSTITLLIALSSALGSLSTPVLAAGEQHAHKAKCAFLANAPDQHVVVKGDTLWGISEKFLEHAWCWPQVWGMNRDDIKNPHWIYPGQIVYFDRAAGRLRLGKRVGSKGTHTEHLSPRIRVDEMGNAITTIPANAIEPFLSQPLVFATDELANAPHIVAAAREHVSGSPFEKVYAAGDLGGHSEFQVYRPSTTLVDPANNELLGYEYTYIGSLKLIRPGDTPDEASTFFVTKATQELSVGDRLLATPATELANYMPHPPSENVHGRVVSVYGGVSHAGQNQTVAVNLGSSNGMDIGTVLELYNTGGIVPNPGGSPVKLPDEAYGTLFIYRVFDKVSYGLIMRETDSTEIGDTVRSPE